MVLNKAWSTASAHEGRKGTTYTQNSTDTE
jgi:hypothetical protein